MTCIFPVRASTVVSAFSKRSSNLINPFIPNKNYSSLARNSEPISKIFSSNIFLNNRSLATSVEKDNTDAHENSFVIISKNSADGGINETINEELNQECLSSDKIIMFFNGSYTHFKSTRLQKPSAITNAKSIYNLIDPDGTSILVYSMLFKEQTKYPYDHKHFEKSYDIVNRILNVSRQYFENHHLPIIGHSHGCVLALLARSKAEVKFQSKIPLMLLGMGAWHLPSFVNALKLLKDSRSPTFIYFRCEDSLILDDGLKNLIHCPKLGTGEDLRHILNEAFANENNFFLFYM